MKRLVSAALALSLLGGSAAVAASYDHGGQGYDGGYGNQGYNGSYGNQDRGNYTRGHGNNDGQHRHHYHQGWYNRKDGRYSYDNGNNRGYGSNYGDRHGGNGDNERH